MIRAAALVVVAASPAVAQERVPAPDGFVEAVMATSTAQILAVNCPVLSINPGAMSAASAETLALLEAEGFTPENLQNRMEDPTNRIAALQDAFLAKHDMAEGASSDAVCGAGLREIREGTDIGALLLEVEG